MIQIQTPNHHTLLLEVRDSLKNTYEAANAPALLRLTRVMRMAHIDELEDFGSVIADVEAVRASLCPSAPRTDLGNSSQLVMHAISESQQ